MSISVSNAGQSTRMNSLLRSLRNDISQSLAQVSSGKKAETFSGLGNDAGTALSLRNGVNRIDSYMTNITTALSRTKVMDSAMSSINTTARDVFTTLSAQNRGSDALSSSVNLEAANALETVQSLLNTPLENRYVFSGDAVDVIPVADNTVIDTNVQAEISAWMAGSQDAATTIAHIEAFTSADLGISADVASAGSVVAWADDGISVDYTVKASNEGFSGILKGLAVISNLTFNSSDVDGYWEIYDAAMGFIDSGASNVDLDVAGLALQANTLDDAQARHENTTAVYKEMIGKIEDVDTAEALTTLQNLQTQLEICYRTIATMRDLSLVNYL